MMLCESRALRLVTRVRCLMKILDRIFPESEIGEPAYRDVMASALEHIARNETTQAIGLLANAVKENPLWLCGYLMIATIYQHARAAQDAIATLERGMDVCKAGLRYLALETGALLVHGAPGHDRQARVIRRAELLARYDHILRRQLALTLFETGQFDEALQYWTERGQAHCA